MREPKWAVVVYVLQAALLVLAVAAMAKVAGALL
jgi:hypothetical protein